LVAAREIYAMLGARASKIIGNMSRMAPNQRFALKHIPPSKAR
jgi:hypothetical protein